MRHGSGMRRATALQASIFEHVESFRIDPSTESLTETSISDPRQQLGESELNSEMNRGWFSRAAQLVLSWHVHGRFR